MKRNLRISTLATVCVLCMAVSGAYAASSVRNLGGTGTYTSASSAASANSSGATTAVRGGSVRVTPTSGVTGSSTTTGANANTSTSGRVATVPRLSIGHYLGGATSVSGGSSLRPQTPGGSSVSGGGSSSGGEIDPDTLEGLRNQIDDLQRDVDDLNELKQDELIAPDGLIVIDANNEITIDVENLANEMGGLLGASRLFEFRTNDTHLQWRYEGEGDSDWRDLVALDDLRGPQGEQGEQGEPGVAPTVEEIIAAIEDTLQEKITDAVAAAIADAGLVTDEDLARGLADKVNTDDVYTKDQVYTKIEVDDIVDGIVVGDLAGYVQTDEFNAALNLKADKTEVDTLTGRVVTVEEESKEAALAAGQALAGLSAKEDKDNKVDTLDDSTEHYPSTAAVTDALAGYVTTGGLDELTGRVTTAEGEIDAVQSGLTSVQTTIGTGTMETAAQTIIGAINEINELATGLPTDENFDQMNDRLDAVEGNLDAKQDKNMGPGSANMIVVTDGTGTITTTQTISADNLPQDVQDAIDGAISMPDRPQNSLLGTDASGELVWHEIL